VAGHLILNRTHDPRALLVALGEGVWDAAVKVWYRGGELTDTDFNFHPGTQATSVSDTVQGVDSFFPGGLTYSTTAYVAVRLPSEETDPDPAQLIGRYRTRLVDDYDMNGNAVGTGYSSNPARILIDILIKDGKIAPARIDWPSWYNWKVYCDTVIEWNDGKAVRQIKRFESHVAYTGPSTTVDALNMFTDMSASYWQDDGALIHFFPVESRTPVTTFSTTTIISGSFNHYLVDSRQQATRLVLNFRDLDSEFLAPASWTAKDEEGIDQRGVIDATGSFSFGAMHYSQAQRLAKYWLRRAGGSPERIELETDGSTLAILPGDLVTVDHPALPQVVDCHVMETEDSSAGADNRRFVLSPWKPIYFDQDHEPIPATLVV
jgi:hypothetical protein